MCGIVGYIGKNEAAPILIQGLKALEYRGYDSAGIAIGSNGSVLLQKAVGHVEVLEKIMNVPVLGNIGIAHTRWATHGIPNETNAHPHVDCHKRIFVVHNGIIENYKELRHYLIEQGHTFSSGTDTESAAHLIEEFLRQGKDFKTALLHTFKMIKGAYAFVILDREQPGRLFAAKLSSPLVIGIGVQEQFVASDPSALVGKTEEVIYVKDGEMAELTEESVSITNFDAEPTSLEIVRLEWTLEQAQKGNYPHFMLKEIFEGPDVVQAAFQGRLKENGIVKLGGLEQVEKTLQSMKRLVIVACGTSYYAGLIGEYFFEELGGIPTEVHLASEFRYRTQPFDQGTVMLAISQSGETADTLAALRSFKAQGFLTLGLVNVVGSTIARETDAGVYNHAGPEIGVASTKAFLSQITILTLMAAYLSRSKSSELQQVLHELSLIPEKIQTVLHKASTIERLAELCMDYENFLYLGRRYNYPTALEGALKLKEISYIHAEGCGAGEMKHGLIAMVSPEFPTLAIVPSNAIAEKMYINLEEIKARTGPIIAIATEGDKKISSLANEVIFIPQTIEPLEPLLTVIPLQLFAYFVGVKKGLNVDRPRNLAKSVTVE